MFVCARVCCLFLLALRGHTRERVVGWRRARPPPPFWLSPLLSTPAASPLPTHLATLPPKQHAHTHTHAPPTPPKNNNNHHHQTHKGVFRLLKARAFVEEGDLVVLVSDLRPSEDDIIRSVQMRRVQ